MKTSTILKEKYRLAIERLIQYELREEKATTERTKKLLRGRIREISIYLRKIDYMYYVELERDNEYKFNQMRNIISQTC